MILYVAYVEALNGNRLYNHDTDEEKVKDWVWRSVNLLSEAVGQPVSVLVEWREI